MDYYCDANEEEDEGPLKRFLEMSDVEIFLHMSRSEVCELIRSGRLRTVTMDGRQVIPLLAVIEYIALQIRESEREAEERNTEELAITNGCGQSFGNSYSRPH